MMTFPNLFKITPETFGIDLSDRSIKIAKLARKGSAFVLENFGEKEVPEGLMENGVILSEDKLAMVIKESLLELKMGPIKTSYAACSLPEQNTYLRVVQLPKMKKEEVKEAIRWEVEENIPLKLDEIYFDSYTIEPSAPMKQNHVDVLVTAASRKLVDSYISLFQKAKLNLFSLEPESIALSRSIISDDAGEKAVMIADIGLTHTYIIIYAGHSVRFASSFEKISGKVFTSAIASRMKVNGKKAEELKREVGFDKKKDAKVFEALVPSIGLLQDKLGEYMKFYSAHAGHAHDGIAISQILLSGGGAQIKEIEAHLSSALNVPVERADPWVNILDRNSRRIPAVPRKESLRYTTALGLALNGFLNEE